MFQPEDWIRLLSSLEKSTIAGKIDWTDMREPVRGSRLGHALSVSAMFGAGPGELSATVGPNHFRLGSSDLDGREPFYLEVTRTAPNHPSITDSIRSDTARNDFDLYETADMINRLYEAARQHVVAKGRVVEDIISDLDNL